MTQPVISDVRPQEIAAGVHVIPDERIDLVPNVGFVVGEDALLVVDTGMGVANAERVLARARELADDRQLLLTLTHFHPEHGFGAQVFRNEAVIVYNGTQLDELEEKFDAFVEMFSGFSPGIAEILTDVRLVRPHVVYHGEAELDLGAKLVRLREVGPAHTRGDQVITVPEEGVLFAGDLVENRFYPILPDEDAHGSLWIDVLAALEEDAPAIVVPGHGAVGDAGLIRGLRGFLESLRSDVAELSGAGRSLDEIQAELEPRIREERADWDNPIWISFAIANFHGELDEHS